MKKILAAISVLNILLALPACTGQEAKEEQLKTIGEKQFKGWDMNHDGKVSRAEFVAAKMKKMEGDTDHDGKLSEAELVALKTKSLIDVTPEDVQRRAKSQIEHMDTDHDGLISVPEFVIAQKKAFTKMDVNHDGFISEAEAVDAKVKFGH